MRWSIGRFGLRAVAAAVMGFSLAGVVPPPSADDDLVDESAKKTVEEELVVNANGSIDVAASINQLVYGNQAQNHSPQERLELRLQRRVDLLAQTPHFRRIRSRSCSSPERGTSGGSSSGSNCSKLGIKRPRPERTAWIGVVS